MNRLTFSSFLILLVFMSIVPGPVTAFEKIADDFVFISEEEEIDNNLIIFADSADIEGRVSGDLIVAAGVVNIKGTVEGDVIAAGGDVTISGEVGGDIRAVSGTLTLEDVVGGNVTALSGKVIIGSEAEIGHSVTAATGLFENKGAVVKHINVAAGSITLNGPVGGNLNARVDNDGLVILLPNSRIGGDVNYSALNELERAQGAEVAGIIRRIDTTTIRPSSTDLPLQELLFFFKTLSLLGALVVGLLIINVFPKASQDVSNYLLKAPFKLILLGFAYFFLIPLALVIMMFTIVGFPLAVMLLLIYIVTLYLAKIAVALALGKLIIQKSSAKKVNLFFPLFFGILLVYLISSVPFIGWFAGILFTWWGLGGIVQKGYTRYKKSGI